MARVRNLRSYDAVSRDVGARWAFPLAPDTCALPPPSPAWGRPTYRASRSGVYREQGVSVARGARVGLGGLRATTRHTRGRTVVSWLPLSPYTATSSRAGAGAAPACCAAWSAAGA